MQACFEEKIQSLDKDMLNSFLGREGMKPRLSQKFKNAQFLKDGDSLKCIQIFYR